VTLGIVKQFGRNLRLYLYVIIMEHIAQICKTTIIARPDRIDGLRQVRVGHPHHQQKAFKHRTFSRAILSQEYVHTGKVVYLQIVDASEVLDFYIFESVHCRCCVMALR
jgi:hypothetical protein